MVKPASRTLGPATDSELMLWIYIMDITKLGRVERLKDGADQVSFSRNSKHGIEKVWDYITGADKLAIWFPGLRLEQKVGGKFDIWFTGDCDGPAHVSGLVNRYEPPAAVVAETSMEKSCSIPEQHHAVLECGSLRYKLSSTSTGCQILFTDRLQFDNKSTRAEFCNSVLDGWHRFLDMLEAELDQLPFDHSQGEFDYASIAIQGRD